MKNDLISREDLKKAIDHFQYTDEFCVKHQIDNSISLHMLKKIINNAPTVEIDEGVIQKVLNNKCMSVVANEYLKALHGKGPQGEWQFMSGGYYKCNKCPCYSLHKTNYCSNCGAQMNKGGEV